MIPTITSELRAASIPTFPDEVIQRDVGCHHRCSWESRRITAAGLPTLDHCGSGQPSGFHRCLTPCVRVAKEWVLILSHLRKRITSPFKDLLFLYFKRESQREGMERELVCRYVHRSDTFDPLELGSWQPL